MHFGLKRNLRFPTMVSGKEEVKKKKKKEGEGEEKKKGRQMNCCQK